MEKLRFLLSVKSRQQYYVEAITNMGAEAITDYPPKIDTSYDGLILCGGGDIDPKYYDEPIDGSKYISAERDEVEFALLKAYVEAGKPVFGICRGYQVINVFFGGSMYQHIPEVDLHSADEGPNPSHEITAAADSILGRLYGTSFRVNSSHHQAVKRIGKGLRPTAWWNDQYVEALEHESLPIFGVQWHPERMSFSQRREDTVDGAPLFAYFVQLCKK